MYKQGETSDLIKRACKGDHDAFSSLIKEHERMVYNLVYRMLPNPEDAKDLSQEVFIKVYKYLNKFDGKASFSTWVYRITVNTCIDELRKRRGKETISFDAETDLEDGSLKSQYPDNAPSVEAQVLEKEGLRNLKQTLESLTDEHKTIITLRDIEGLSYIEISEITEVNIGTVKSRLARARKALKDLLISQKEQTKSSNVK